MRSTPERRAAGLEEGQTRGIPKQWALWAWVSLVSTFPVAGLVTFSAVFSVLLGCACHG